MKKLLTFALVLSVAGGSFAYAGGGYQCHFASAEQKDKKIQKKLDKMTKKLNLDETQQGQVEAILRTKMDKKYAAKQKMKDEMAAISKEFRSKMDGILKADQKGSFEDMVAAYEKKKAKKYKKKKRFLFF